MALGILSICACWEELTSNTWHVHVLKAGPGAISGPDEVHRPEGCREKNVG